MNELSRGRRNPALLFHPPDFAEADAEEPLVNQIEQDNA
jgi:hypothetical protein